MQTWEMIKELTENPNKKFKRVGDGLVVWGDGLGYLRWEPGHDYINIDHEWEEVKEPVDFMEAVKSRKNIRVKHAHLECNEDFNEYVDLEELLYRLHDNFFSDAIAVILLEGKFYIE